MPWRGFGAPSAEREYVALLSYLPLKSIWRVPAFMIYTGRIMKQLASAEGLTGYSLLARPFAKKFWTLSAWESDAALHAFVHNPPHQRIMAALAPHMETTKFIRWKVKGAVLPLKWEAALAKFDATIEGKSQT